MKIGVRTALAAALFILGATFALRELVEGGMLDGSVGTRAFMLANGVIVALFGNRIPKTLLPPSRSAEAERRRQAALRSSGWVMTLAGLLYALLWLIAPEAFAQPVSLGVLALATFYTFYRAARCKLGGRGAPA
jgi:cobalamin synthase